MSTAEHFAKTFSKDPTSKVASLIVNERQQLVAHGYNGFPRGFDDNMATLMDRQAKLDHTIHAEVNALLKYDLWCPTSTMYVWPYPPCNDCMKLIIQKGIKRLVTPPDYPARWQESMVKAHKMAMMAGIEVSSIRGDEVEGAYLDTTNNTVILPNHPLQETGNANNERMICLLYTSPSPRD